MPKQYRKSAYSQALAVKRAEKALDMAQRYEAGSTLQEIGNYYGITRERVRQLIKGELGMTGKDGGWAKRGRDRAAALAAKRQHDCFAKHGMSIAEYSRARSCLDARGHQPQSRFQHQRKNAERRGIAWEMTFADWWSIWEKSGKWMERGRGRGYVMSRHGDKGPYATWNVRIIPAPQNNSEFIRRFHAEVKAGIRPPAKAANGKARSPLYLIDLGQTITLPITQKRPEYARNHALWIAGSRGWKFRTSVEDRVLTVTRVA